MEIRYKTNKAVNFFIIFIGIVFLFMILKEMQHIFIPFVIAYMFYFVFAPLNEFLQKKKVPLAVCILLDILIIVLIVGGSTRFFVDSLVQFKENFGLYANKLNFVVRSVTKSIGIPDPELLYFNLNKIIKEIDYKLLATNVVNATLDIIGSVFFIIFFFVFIEGGHHAILAAFKKRYVTDKKQKKIGKLEKRYFKFNSQDSQVVAFDNANKMVEIRKKNVEEKLESTFRKITSQIQKYIVVKMGMNALAGVLVYLLLYFLNIDFPIIWGTFTFLLNFIPTIGSALALIFPTLMALIQYQSIGKALLIAILIAVTQTAAFNLIEPKILGKQLNLNPIVILLSVLVWGYIWGIVGMFLAVPLTAIIKIILSNSKSKDIKFIANLMSQEKDIEESK